jgi:hypothetical protein
VWREGLGRSKNPMNSLGIGPATFRVPALHVLLFYFRKKLYLDLSLILSRFRGDYRRYLDWRMDLLTTYTHDSEIHAITAPPLISTIQNHHSTC